MERDYRRQSPRDSNGRPPDHKAVDLKHDRRIIQNERNQEKYSKINYNYISNFLDLHVL